MRTKRKGEREIAKKRRIMALSEAISDNEKKFGEITADELASQERADRKSAIVIRPRRRSKANSASAGRLVDLIEV
jgi:hypothetical protein